MIKTSQGTLMFLDIAEYCSGKVAGCPEDTYLDTQITCRHAEGVCDIPILN